jgi:hypothetical protein
MTFSRNTVAKGGGAIGIRRISDGRLLFLNTNSKYTFTKSTSDGDKVQGFNSDGTLIDLDVAGQEETYTLDVTSKKNSQNINELVLNSAFVNKTSYQAPWVESAAVDTGAVTLKGGTPVASSLSATYLDGAKLTSTGSTPSAAGQYKDNGDGTVTFHSGDNGKNIVFFYKINVANIATQGGADHDPLGYLEVMFHQVGGTSSTSGKKGVDILWLPKCSLSGESTLEFDNTVQDKAFKLTALIPDTPTGFKVPYVLLRNLELDNTNAG